MLDWLVAVDSVDRFHWLYAVIGKVEEFVRWKFGEVLTHNQARMIPLSDLEQRHPLRALKLKPRPSPTLLTVESQSLIPC